MAVEICSICLQSNILLRGIAEFDKQTTWLDKLESFVAEVKFSVTAQLCSDCCNEIDIICAFRAKCIASQTPKIYPCKQCPATFNISTLVTTHNKEFHKLLRPHNCVNCIKSFKTLSELLDHKKVHSNTVYKNKQLENTKQSEENYECSVYLKNFDTKDNLKIHEECTSFNNKYDSLVYCFECNNSFESKNDLEIHIFDEHVRNNRNNSLKKEESSNFIEGSSDLNEPFGDLTEISNDFKETLHCFHCKNSFSSKIDLEEHLSTEHLLTTITETKHSSLERDKSTLTDLITIATLNNTDKPTLKCDSCLSTFTTKYLLKRHINNVHATERTYKCDECIRSFTSQVYLTAHRKYHERNRRHICPVCGKAFITTSDLYHHEKIHENKRSYQCNSCPKTFNTSSDLHKHKLCVHVSKDLWKYPCEFCARTFPLKSNLDTHRKSQHTGEKDFSCHLCERKFVSKAVLRRHVLTHSNMRRFKCDVCSAEYKCKRSLEVHELRVHKLGLDSDGGEKKARKFMCHICPEVCSSKLKLERHIRGHDDS